MASDDTLLGTLPTAASTDDANLGALVANRYRIVRWLGGGGMGRVYEAYDTELDERIALKVLRGGLTDDALERFRREVRLTRRIQHPHVARMFDIGEHGGERFLTMELVDGEPLSRAFATRPAWPQLRAVALQICEGLAAAHATGVVHRDLKPDNVLVEDSTGRAVITDFGIARGGDEVQMTQVGAIIGTPSYMAPEQLAGGDLDARADLFSLGVMLFELASGALPWPGDSAVAIAVAQATQPARTFASRTMPAALGELIMRCLSLDPAERPASARDVAAALAAIDDAAPAERPSRTTLAAPVRPTPWPSTNAAPAPAAETTIAVLPFERCAPEDRYLADGLREDLIDTLSVTAGLRVRPASAPDGCDVREAGRDLQVDHVVAGSLQRTPAGLRVAARLISVADGFQIWAYKALCTEAEVLAVSDTVATGIAKALSTRAVPLVKPLDPRAVELYLRAREELRRFWGDHALQGARLLDEAAAIAPDAVQILGAQAYAHVQAWTRSNRPESLARARAIIARAIEADVGEGYLAAGVLHMNTGDHVAAARAYRAALLRAPMSAAVHEHIGRLLVEIDAGPTGRQFLETALQLDGARDVVIAGDLARLAAFDERWDEVDRRLAPILHHPDPSIRTAGILYTSRYAAWRGDMQFAIDELVQMGPRMNPLVRDLFMLLRETLGGAILDLPHWRGLLQRLVVEIHASRTRLIMVQRMVEFGCCTGQHGAAIEALEIAGHIDLVDVVWLDRCIALAPLRSHPRWMELRAPIAERAARVLAAYQAG